MTHASSPGRPGFERFLANQDLQLPPGLIPQLAGGGAMIGMIEDTWKGPSHFPDVEERGPVDIVDEVAERLVLDDAASMKVGGPEGGRSPVEAQPAAHRLVIRQEFDGRSGKVSLARSLLFLPHLVEEGTDGSGVGQSPGHVHRAGGIANVNRHASEAGGDLDRGVLGAGCRSANQ